MYPDSEERDAAPCPSIALTIAPDFLEVRRALAEMRQRFAPILPDDPISTFEIIAAEVLNNVVEHGFGDHPAQDGCIDITAVVDGTSLRFEVVDNGKPMPGNTVPSQREHDIDPDDLDGLPEGGFGWNLIHMLSDELTYMRQDGKNHLRVTIAVKMETMGE